MRSSENSSSKETCPRSGSSSTFDVSSSSSIWYLPFSIKSPRKNSTWWRCESQPWFRRCSNSSKKLKKPPISIEISGFGPSGETQTHGLTLPKRPFYQLNYTRLSRSIIAQIMAFVKKLWVGIIVVKIFKNRDLEIKTSLVSIAPQWFPGFCLKPIDDRTQGPKASALPTALHPDTL